MKRKKNQKVLLVLHGISAGALTASPQMLLSSVLPLLHHMPGVSFINMISANNNESVALKGQISFS